MLVVVFFGFVLDVCDDVGVLFAFGIIFSLGVLVVVVLFIRVL